MKTKRAHTQEEAQARALLCAVELYGSQISELKVERTEPFPLFKEPKIGWLVLVSFKDPDGCYTLQMEFSFDGNLTKSMEIGREAAK